MLSLGRYCWLGLLILLGGVSGIFVWSTLFAPLEQPAARSNPIKAPAVVNLPNPVAPGLPTSSSAPKDEPSWAIGQGKTWWREKPRTIAAAKSPDGKPVPFDVGEVIDRARHQIGRDPGRPLAMISDTYSAEFDREGLRFQPFSSATQSRPELRLKTASVAVNGKPLSLTKSREWSVQGNVAQIELAPGIVEHYEMRSDGAAMTWIVKKKPKGSLRLTMQASGMQPAGKTEGGIHFADVAGTPRVRVSHVTTVDAGGKRTSFPLAQAGNSLQVVVPADLLAKSSYPLAIDPIVSAEFGLDEPVYGPSLFGAFDPRVASSGADWLIVWQEKRSSLTRPDYMGTVVNADGTIGKSFRVYLNGRGMNDIPWLKVSGGASGWLVIVPTLDGYDAVPISKSGEAGASIPIVVGQQLEEAPLSANEEGWLIAWGSSHGDIYGKIISAAGAGGTTFPICTATGEQALPSVAGVGSTWLVSWQDRRTSETTGEDLYGAIVDSTGNVGAEIPICVTTSTQNRYSSVTSNGVDWLAIWIDAAGEAFARKVFSTGTLGAEITLGNDGILKLDPKCSSNGVDWLVLWRDNHFPQDRPMKGAVVTAAGAILTEVAIPFRAFQFDLDNCGSDWLVLCHEYYPDGISTILVHEDGQVEAKVHLRDNIRPDDRVSISGNENGWLMVWPSLAKVFGTLSPPTGVPGETFYASNVPSPQIGFSLDSDGTDWLVAWAESRDEASVLNIYATLVNAEGIGSEIFTICEDSGNQFVDSVRCNGSSWLIAWSGSPDANARIFTPPGTLGPKINLSTSAFLRVDAAGPDWLAVWEDAGDLDGAIIRSTGEVVPGLVISSMPGADKNRFVVGNGLDWLVVWRRNNGATGDDIFGSVVASNGTVGPILTLCSAAGSQDYPRASANGSDWLVVWRDLRDQISTGSDIYGATVSGQGIPNSNFSICSAPGDQYPALAGSSQGWLVAWTDERDKAANGTDIYGRIVSTLGSPGTEFAIANGSGDQTELEVLGRSTGWIASWKDADFTRRGMRIAANGGLLSSAGGFTVLSEVSSGTSMVEGSDGNFLSVGPGIAAERYTPAGTTEEFEVASLRLKASIVRFKPTIHFAPIANPIYSGSPMELIATSDSGAPVQFEVSSGPATVAGNQLTLTGLGAVTILATSAATGDFDAADPVSRSFTVLGDDPEIVLSNLTHVYDGTAKGATVSVTPDTLPATVTYNGNTSVPINPGTYSIVATVSAPGYFGQATGTLLIEKITQLLQFSEVDDVIFGHEAIALSATSNANLDDITFSVVSGPANIDENLLTITGPGQVHVRASSAGNAFYAAGVADQVFEVGKRSQSISFLVPAELDFTRSPVALQATSNQGLEVSLSLLGGPGILQGRDLALTNLGKINIEANQSGNATISPAASILRTIEVVDISDPKLATNSDQVATQSNYYTLRVKATDNYSAEWIEYRRKLPGGKWESWAKARLPGLRSVKTWSKRIPLPRAGRYKVELRAIDFTGNTSRKISATIDKK